MMTTRQTISNLSFPASALKDIWRQWAGWQTLKLLAPGAGAFLLIVLVGWRWPALRWGAGLLLALALGGLIFWLYRLWQPDLHRVARRLDRLYPSLEDSTGLLLRPAASLNLLEQLQQQRTGQQLQELRTHHRPVLPVAWRNVALVTLLLLLASGAVALWPTPAAPHSAPALRLHFPDAPGSAAPGAAPRILSTVITVTPPAYTRQPAFSPAQPSFRCPHGARVRWLVRVSGAGKPAPVLELNRRRLPLRPVAGQPNEFFTEQVLAASALYQLHFAGRRSDDYAIDVQPDQAPAIRILTPKPYTLLEFGSTPTVAIRVALRDDYGLTRARLFITTAQGQGEGVKFREVSQDLSAGLRNGPEQATLTRRLNLPALGLTYGDELYFYVQAWDNAGHSARTDAYLVQWEDTTVADAPSDLGLSVQVMPAYFRSQRQIIIDTEKLLAERRQLPAATVAERANTLGFDQKVLRLRYGKFLGEESEQSIGQTTSPADTSHTDDDGHDHASHTPEPASIEALQDPYVHKHEDEETADFLEPAVKAKLRAVLSQMWEAELRLRTVRPAEALPFEYRALRLLKQVQQQTRAYVRKSGFEPPPLSEATLRLGGELAGAAAPTRQQMRPAPSRQEAVRRALSWLEATRQGQPTHPPDAELLSQAGQELARAALREPGAYLGALSAVRRLEAEVRAGKQPCPSCQPAAVRALTRLLPAAIAVPRPAPAPDRLGRRYFEQLQ
ncbi:DUF4175 domain-containing protein [Hymenobacter sp. BT175]|uniref:DUF4175 domain-containing protein n=1 Tax=Hymenobacter translucens TaxID=2886507 RepID=UPI001D0DEE39|nr:DUF4175 domain-containing protein [Hymenobacter translucens]MCC2545952.1 DUF4175 domain-containing protein [Hymenobacter translucens]